MEEEDAFSKEIFHFPNGIKMKQLKELWFGARLSLKHGRQMFQLLSLD